MSCYCIEEGALERNVRLSAGYSIFVIRGNLLECEAEQILGLMRVQQQQRPRLIGEDEAQSSSGQRYEYANASNRCQNF